MTQNKPFFYDITLRDGNQALRKPWNLREKEIIFKKLLELGVQGIEVGFPNASEMDFEAVEHLSKIAPDNVVISALARCVEADIRKAAEAIKFAPKPRIHTFMAMNPLGIEYVIKKPLLEIKEICINAVKLAKSLLPENGDVEFSVEHFGDCTENLDDVINALKEIVDAGATTINLPNTVERFRPHIFIEMVEKVKKALPENITISVHCHNDLGMATATTVESYFAGATQLECSLNGLGERSGNTNMYEVAVTLYNSGIDIPLSMDKIYETALLTSEMANVPIWEKAPLIGYDALAHRSGIHQDGVAKTKHLKKGAYRAFNPELIGRGNDELLEFTSQSGKTALYEILNSTPYKISMQEAIYLSTFAKHKAEEVGNLSPLQLIDLYLDEICDIKGEFELIDFRKIDANKFNLSFNYKKEEYDLIAKGNGPIEACINALKKAGFDIKLINYEQKAIEALKGEEAEAMSIMQFDNNGKGTIIARAINKSTAEANVKAIFNGLNLMSK